MTMTLTLALSLVAGQAGAPPAVARAIEQIEQRLAATWQKGDCDGWAAMLAPEWSVIHITANIITKAQAVGMCRDPQFKLASSNIDDLSIRSYGDTAIATGRATATTSGDSPQTVRLRFTDVFVRRNGKWLAVTSQATQIP
jgi:ketosteroid isomerase-like protein